MTPNKNLTLAVKLFRESTVRDELAGNKVELQLKPGVKLEPYQELLDQGIISRVDGGDNVLVFHKITNFFWDADDFLLKPERRIKPLSLFYVAAQDWCSTDEPPHELQEALTRIFKLLSILKEVAEHIETKGNNLSLIMFHKEKLIIGSDYSPSDMQALPSLDKLEEFLNSDSHRDKKIEIFKAVLSEFYAGKKRVELGRVIVDLKEIISRAIHGYDLFVADFSFDKIRSEVERDKLEFTTRLNKVFSDVQNQLLAVPAALLLVGSQMKKGGTAELQISNVAIWLGAVLFFALMELLIRNQRNTLQAIKNEIDLQKDIFEDRYTLVYKKFEGVYINLADRFTHQCRLLWFIRGLVGAVLGFTTGMLVWYSSLSIGYATISGILLTILPFGVSLMLSDFSELKGRKKS
ncbi:hypothetical protein GCM10027040_23710 [Halomonas shantousis]